MTDRLVTAFAPATVSNVACGFDVLGFPMEEPGDFVTARLIASGVQIDDITGDQGRLPRDPERNTASVAARAMLEAAGERRGVALTIRKGLPLASGLGGSAASAAAAVVAVNALIGRGASIDTLVRCALEGEVCLQPLLRSHSDYLKACGQEWAKLFVDPRNRSDTWRTQ